MFLSARFGIGLMWIKSVAETMISISSFDPVSALDHIQTAFAIAPKCDGGEASRLAMCDNTAGWADTCQAGLDAVVECVGQSSFVLHSAMKKRKTANHFLCPYITSF